MQMTAPSSYSTFYAKCIANAAVKCYSQNLVEQKCAFKRRGVRANPALQHVSSAVNPTTWWSFSWRWLRTLNKGAFFFGLVSALLDAACGVSLTFFFLIPDLIFCVFHTLQKTAQDYWCLI